MELKFDPQNPNYEYITTEAAAKKALNLLAEEPMLGIDVECVGLNPHLDKLLLVQIGSDEKSYIFDARKLDLSKIPEYKKVIEKTKVIKILHNGKYD